MIIPHLFFLKKATVWLLSSIQNDFVIKSWEKGRTIQFQPHTPKSLLCTLMMLIQRPSILLLLAFLLVQPCTLQLSQSSNNFTDQSALIAFKSSISFGPNDTVFAASNWSIMTMAIGCLVSRWASTIYVLLTLNLKNILGFDSHISVISKTISHLLCMC